jgi:hypothetical protein
LRGPDYGFVNVSRIFVGAVFYAQLLTVITLDARAKPGNNGGYLSKVMLFPIFQYKLP